MKEMAADMEASDEPPSLVNLDGEVVGGTEQGNLNATVKVPITIVTGMSMYCHR